jgi:uncharacterized phage-associated protein
VNARGKIWFQFQPEKLADAMAFLAAHVPALTTLKAAKLLYIADRRHLLEHGRPIVGDWYVCLRNGPAPSASVELLEALRDTDPATWSDEVRMLSEHVVADNRGKHPAFVPATDCVDTDNLSESDLGALRSVVDAFGGYDASVLVDITHRERPWNHAREVGAREIDYLWFFEGELGKDDLVELVIEEQEHRDFVAGLLAQA